MKKATIYEYARICRATEECSFCPLHPSNNGTNLLCNIFIETYPDKANRIILNWCEGHPIKTRQSEFLKMFPNARTDDDGVIGIAPCTVEKRRMCYDCYFSDSVRQIYYLCTMSQRILTCGGR